MRPLPLTLRAASPGARARLARRLVQTLGLSLLLARVAGAEDQIVFFGDQPAAGEPVTLRIRGNRPNAFVHALRHASYVAGGLIRVEADLEVGGPPIPASYELRVPLGPLPAGAYRVEYYTAEAFLQPFPHPPQFNAALEFALSPASGGCLPSPTVLCVDDEPNDGRFRARASFATAQGGGLEGEGRAFPLAHVGVARGGLFSFFSLANPEVLVKILDGCSVNGNRWGFVTAGTNVGFTVEVTDTLTGRTWTTTNPDGEPARPVQDLTALPCFMPEPV